MKKTIFKILSVVLTITILSSLCITAFAKDYDFTYTCLECGGEAVFQEQLKDFENNLCPHCGGKLDRTHCTFTRITYMEACFYCYHVLKSGDPIPEDAHCPNCDKPYNREHLPAIGENGELLFGGGGDNIRYCPETGKFYQNTYCPYSQNQHDNKPVKIIYEATCPECKTINRRTTRDAFFEPFMLNTLNNAFASIFMDVADILSPEVVESLDMSNTCVNCKFKFTEDNITVNRYIDAPEEAQYEHNDADRPYRESDSYAEEKRNEPPIKRFFGKISDFFRRIADFLSNLFSFTK